VAPGGTLQGSNFNCKKKREEPRWGQCQSTLCVLFQIKTSDGDIETFLIKILCLERRTGGLTREGVTGTE